jgi:hypothetical protein
MKYEKGNWKVIRNCCTSGMCITCKGHKERPIRFTQAEGYSQVYAEYVASNWQSYHAEAVEDKVKEPSSKYVNSPYSYDRD